MKTIKLLPTLLLLSTLIAPLSIYAQSTAFTYQGFLTDQGAPLNGAAELQLTLWNAPSNGTQVAAIVPASVIVGVTNGLFTVPVDFGASAFNGQDRWMQIDVRTTIGPFSTLAPRQPVTATPYALIARGVTGTIGTSNIAGTYGNAVNFTNGGNNFNGTFTGDGAGVKNLNASQLATGTVPSGRLAGVYSGVVRFTNINNDFVGAFIGDGITLTNLNASALANGTVPDARLSANVAQVNTVWAQAGNAGTTPGTDFVGTTDLQALEIKVNNSRALRLAPNSNGAPSLVGGSAANVIDATVLGGFIGGGGATNLGAGTVSTNRIRANFGVIAGGLDNLIDVSSVAGVVGGGEDNQIRGSAIYGTISGGFNNTITNTANYGVIGGGVRNRLNGGSNNVVGGGGFNTIHLNTASVIAGGNVNTIGTNVVTGVIAGGDGNDISRDASFTFIGGGQNNLIGQNADRSVVAGGDRNTARGTNSAILGGGRNTIETNAGFSVIGGGEQNTNHVGTGYSVIAGGGGNEIFARLSVIGGGSLNDIGSNSTFAVVGGGSNNNIGTNSPQSSIGGGADNNIQAFVNSGTIGGGFGNVIASNASAAIIPGGYEAKADKWGQMAHASGSFANPGDAQGSDYILRFVTTNASIRELFLDGTNDRLRLNNTDTTWAFEIMVVARATTGGITAGYRFEGMIERDGGSINILGTPTKTILFEDAGALSWDANVSDSNASLTVTVSANTADPVRWVARVRTVEVAF